MDEAGPWRDFEKKTLLLLALVLEKLALDAPVLRLCA
jgi:hypothetical protein